MKSTAEAKENPTAKKDSATTNTSKKWECSAYDEMLVGKPDEGNPHVRFDEREPRDWPKPPVALYSTVRSRFKFCDLSRFSQAMSRSLLFQKLGGELLEKVAIQ